MQQNPNSGVIFPERFFSTEDVQLRASFRVRFPGVLPEGMVLDGALYFALRHLGNESAYGIDWVELFYSKPEQRLVIYEGNIVTIPRPTGRTPSDASGTVTIQGKKGLWRDGAQLANGTWKRGVIHVGWQPNPVLVTRNGKSEFAEETEPGEARSCILHAFTNEIDLQQLVEIADSMT